jgi:hypothetical protein
VGVGRRLILAAAIAVSLASLPTAPASAGDRDSAPPKTHLEAAGSEGLLGPHSEALAYFSAGSGGRRHGYTNDSRVRFTCRVDGRRVHCPVRYSMFLAIRHGRAVRLPGSFDGWVPIPKWLAQGSHTVSVVARDEDGVDPKPKKVEIFFDRTPPSAPELTAAPPPVGRDHMPVFGFTASDETQLVREDEEVFTGALVRLKPTRFVYRSDRFGNGFLSVWPLECPTLLTCSNQARAAYAANERSYSYGEEEWLNPGLYELRLRAHDAVGNDSPRTSYRFRILPGTEG